MFRFSLITCILLLLVNGYSAYQSVEKASLTRLSHDSRGLRPES